MLQISEDYSTILYDVLISSFRSSISDGRLSVALGIRYLA